jgi:hypothetical protein
MGNLLKAFDLRFHRLLDCLFVQIFPFGANRLDSNVISCDNFDSLGDNAPKSPPKLASSVMTNRLIRMRVLDWGLHPGMLDGRRQTNS